MPIPGDAPAAAAAAAAHRTSTGGSLGGLELDVIRPPTAMKDGSAVPAEAPGPGPGLGLGFRPGSGWAGPGPSRNPRGSTSFGGADILSISEDAEYHQNQSQSQSHAVRPPTGLTRSAHGPRPETPGYDEAVRAALRSGVCKP
jgi:hypothetical protein